jgi:hypothetical protein
VKTDLGRTVREYGVYMLVCHEPDTSARVVCQEFKVKIPGKAASVGPLHEVSRQHDAAKAAGCRNATQHAVRTDIDRLFMTAGQYMKLKSDTCLIFDQVRSRSKYDTIPIKRSACIAPSRSSDRVCHLDEVM